MRHILANVCFLGLIAGFGALSALNPDVYYLHVQEDQPLEWSTFWAFVAAGAFFLRAAYLDRQKRPLPWFFIGLAAFCVLVAAEEISWGQRVLGYSPPRYFLENNYQQEFNLHNVLPTALRKQIIGTLITLYGLLLPLLARIPWSRGVLAKVGITAPPLALMPTFAALLALLLIYPISYTGEIVEAGMALVFLFAAVDGATDEGIGSSWRVPVGALSLIITFGFGSALWSRGRLAADPVVAEVAATEIRALEHDLRTLIEANRGACGKHERLNLMSKLFPGKALSDGRFMGLTRRGLPTERAEFFIDPWSTAYWVRTTCNDTRDKLFVYSFGPNRRRDSGRWKLQGDDVGLIFRVREDEPRHAERTH